MSRTGRIAVLLVVVVGIAGCAPPENAREAISPSPTATATARVRLEPRHRLVERRHRAALGDRKSPRDPIILKDVAHRVFSRADSRKVEASCEPGITPPDTLCAIDVNSPGATRRILLEPYFVHVPWAAAKAVADHVQGPIPEARTYAFPMGKNAPLARVQAYEAPYLRARLAPPLHKRWAETPRLEIPPGSVVRFSTGIEEVATRVDSAPVDFVLLAYVGTKGADAPVELFRTSLDPARNPGDRGWHDHEVDLSEVAGPVVRLRFHTEPTNPADERPQLPVWGDPTILSPQSPETSERPFVVLVSLDTLRARSLSALGREIETSPFFDALARQGILFANAFTTYSNTMGSHMSMLTGLWPRSHAVVGARKSLSSKKTTLATRMRAAGYETAAFTENALLNGARGFRRGFGHYQENKEIEDGAGASEETFDEALKWVAKHSNTPFFLFIHTYEVHAPYEPQAPYDALYPAESHSGANVRLYEQEIRYLDDQLRRLVAELDRLVGAESLLLVVTADHGEEFGEHGGMTHSQLYDEVMHVPLLFRWSGAIPANRRVAQPVSLVDIAPTILDLAGVGAFAGQNGVSLTPLIEGDGAIGRQIVFAEAPPSMINASIRQFGARSATHKCLIPEGQEVGSCFDLVSDPSENSPMAPDFDDQTRALHDALLAYRRGSAKAEDDPGTEIIDSHEIDPKRQEKLRALGYVE